MHPPALPDLPANGGLPDPPADEPARVAVAAHADCRHQTRVRLPRELPASALRRVRCAGCETAFEVDDPADAGIEPPAAAGGGQSRGWRVWRWASVPLGAVAVIGGLLLIQTAGEAGSGVTPSATGAAVGEAPAGPRGAPAAERARVVEGARYSVALPAGWRRAPAGGGATLAAASRGGDADASLWIERAPELDLATFERRSLSRLRELAGDARVVDRAASTTAEGRSVRIAAPAPEGEPRHQVTLRAAGPYRYYLATTVRPGASSRAPADVELIHGSLRSSGGGG